MYNNFATSFRNTSVQAHLTLSKLWENENTLFQHRTIAPAEENLTIR